MANRIKGITVEINGNTTGLDKALKSVNTTITKTQSELKDVERLLKLDPSNTELLSQKQRTLKDAVAATRDKLDALKTAQVQAKQQLENGTLGQDKYDALEREIAETEQKLKDLETQAVRSSNSMVALSETGDKMTKLGEGLQSAGKELTTKVTAPILGFGTAAVKVAADFEAKMDKVGAIAGKVQDEDLQGIVDAADRMGLSFQEGSDSTETAMNILSAKAEQMGAMTKFSASEAGEALEYMAMAGWKPVDMLEGLDGIMALAAATGEDLGKTSDIVTDALTAFGLSAGESGHLADILAASSSNANTNVSLLGESFKYVAPVAGSRSSGYITSSTRSQKRKHDWKHCRASAIWKKQDCPDLQGSGLILNMTLSTRLPRGESFWGLWSVTSLRRYSVRPSRRQGILPASIRTVTISKTCTTRRRLRSTRSGLLTMRENPTIRV